MGALAGMDVLAEQLTDFLDIYSDYMIPPERGGKELDIDTRGDVVVDLKELLLNVDTYLECVKDSFGTIVDAIYTEAVGLGMDPDSFAKEGISAVPESLTHDFDTVIKLMAVGIGGDGSIDKAKEVIASKEAAGMKVSFIDLVYAALDDIRIGIDERNPDHNGEENDKRYTGDVLNAMNAAKDLLSGILAMKEGIGAGYDRVEQKAIGIINDRITDRFGEDSPFKVSAERNGLISNEFGISNGGLVDPDKAKAFIGEHSKDPDKYDYMITVKDEFKKALIPVNDLNGGPLDKEQMENPKFISVDLMLDPVAGCLVSASVENARQTEGHSLLDDGYRTKSFCGPVVLPTEDEGELIELLNGSVESALEMKKFPQEVRDLIEKASDPVSSEHDKTASDNDPSGYRDASRPDLNDTDTSDRFENDNRAAQEGAKTARTNTDSADKQKNETEREDRERSDNDGADSSDQDRVSGYRNYLFSNDAINPTGNDEVDRALRSRNVLLSKYENPSTEASFFVANDNVVVKAYFNRIPLDGRVPTMGDVLKIELLTMTVGAFYEIVGIVKFFLGVDTLKEGVERDNEVDRRFDKNGRDVETITGRDDKTGLVSWTRMTITDTDGTVIKTESNYERGNEVERHATFTGPDGKETSVESRISEDYSGRPRVMFQTVKNPDGSVEYKNYGSYGALLDNVTQRTSNEPEFATKVDNDGHVTQTGARGGYTDVYKDGATVNPSDGKVSGAIDYRRYDDGRIERADGPFGKIETSADGKTNTFIDISDGRDKVMSRTTALDDGGKAIEFFGRGVARDPRDGSPKGQPFTVFKVDQDGNVTGKNNYVFDSATRQVKLDSTDRYPEGTKVDERSGRTSASVETRAYADGRVSRFSTDGRVDVSADRKTELLVDTKTGKDRPVARVSREFGNGTSVVEIFQRGGSVDRQTGAVYAKPSDMYHVNSMSKVDSKEHYYTDRDSGETRLVTRDHFAHGAELDVKTNSVAGQIESRERFDKEGNLSSIEYYKDGATLGADGKVSGEIEKREIFKDGQLDHIEIPTGKSSRIDISPDGKTEDRVKVRNNKGERTDCIMSRQVTNDNGTKTVFIYGKYGTTKDENGELKDPPTERAYTLMDGIAVKDYFYSDKDTGEVRISRTDVYAPGASIDPSSGKVDGVPYRSLHYDRDTGEINRIDNFRTETDNEGKEYQILDSREYYKDGALDRTDYIDKNGEIKERSENDGTVRIRDISSSTETKDGKTFHVDRATRQETQYPDGSKKIEFFGKNGVVRDSNGELKGTSFHVVKIDRNGDISRERYSFDKVSGAIRLSNIEFYPGGTTVNDANGKTDKLPYQIQSFDKDGVLNHIDFFKSETDTDGKEYNSLEQRDYYSKDGTVDRSDRIENGELREYKGDSESTRIRYIVPSVENRGGKNVAVDRVIRQETIYSDGSSKIEFFGSKGVVRNDDGTIHGNSFNVVSTDKDGIVKQETLKNGSAIEKTVRVFAPGADIDLKSGVVRGDEIYKKSPDGSGLFSTDDGKLEFKTELQNNKFAADIKELTSRDGSVYRIEVSENSYTGTIREIHMANGERVYTRLVDRDGNERVFGAPDTEKVSMIKDIENQKDAFECDYFSDTSKDEQERDSADQEERDEKDTGDREDEAVRADMPDDNTENWKDDAQEEDPDHADEPDSLDESTENEWGDDGERAASYDEYDGSDYDLDKTDDPIESDSFDGQEEGVDDSDSAETRAVDNNIMSDPDDEVYETELPDDLSGEGEEEFSVDQEETLSKEDSEESSDDEVLAWDDVDPFSYFASEILGDGGSETGSFDDEEPGKADVDDSNNEELSNDVSEPEKSDRDFDGNSEKPASGRSDVTFEISPETEDKMSKCYDRIKEGLRERVLSVMDYSDPGALGKKALKNSDLSRDVKDMSRLFSSIGGGTGAMDNVFAKILSELKADYPDSFTRDGELERRISTGLSQAFGVGRDFPIMDRMERFLENKTIRTAAGVVGALVASSMPVFASGVGAAAAVSSVSAVVAMASGAGVAVAGVALLGKGIDMVADKACQYMNDKISISDFRNTVNGLANDSGLLGGSDGILVNIGLAVASVIERVSEMIGIPDFVSRIGDIVSSFAEVIAPSALIESIESMKGYTTDTAVGAGKIATRFLGGIRIDKVIDVENIGSDNILYEHIHHDDETDPTNADAQENDKTADDNLDEKNIDNENSNEDMDTDRERSDIASDNDHDAETQENSLDFSDDDAGDVEGDEIYGSADGSDEPDVSEEDFSADRDETIDAEDTVSDEKVDVEDPVDTDAERDDPVNDTDSPVDQVSDEATGLDADRDAGGTDETKDPTDISEEDADSVDNSENMENDQDEESADYLDAGGDSFQINDTDKKDDLWDTEAAALDSGMSNEKEADHHDKDDVLTEQPVDTENTGVDDAAQEEGPSEKSDTADASGTNTLLQDGVAAGNAVSDMAEQIQMQNMDVESDRAGLDAQPADIPDGLSSMEVQTHEAQAEQDLPAEESAAMGDTDSRSFEEVKDAMLDYLTDPMIDFTDIIGTLMDSDMGDIAKAFSEIASEHGELSDHLEDLLCYMDISILDSLESQSAFFCALENAFEEQFSDEDNPFNSICSGAFEKEEAFSDLASSEPDWLDQSIVSALETEFMAALFGVDGMDDGWLKPDLTDLEAEKNDGMFELVVQDFTSDVPDILVEMGLALPDDAMSVLEQAEASSAVSADYMDNETYTVPDADYGLEAMNNAQSDSYMQNDDFDGQDLQNQWAQDQLSQDQYMQDQMNQDNMDQYDYQTELNNSDLTQDLGQSDFDAMDDMWSNPDDDDPVE